MYEIWKLYVENYWMYCVREPERWQSSVVTLTFDLLTTKCIGIFLTPSCIYVWNMKAVCWKILKLLCQKQSFNQVLLWPWPLTPKCTGIFLLLSWISVWNLYVENYCSYSARVNVLTKFSYDLDLWPFYPKMYRYLPLSILHLCMKYESCMLITTQVIVSEPKCWQS